MMELRDLGELRMLKELRELRELGELRELRELGELRAVSSAVCCHHNLFLLHSKQSREREGFAKLDKAARQCEEKNWEYLPSPCADWALGRSREQSVSSTGDMCAGRGFFSCKHCSRREQGMLTCPQPALCQLKDWISLCLRGLARSITGWVCWITELVPGGYSLCWHRGCCTVDEKRAIPKKLRCNVGSPGWAPV